MSMSACILGEIPTLILAPNGHQLVCTALTHSWEPKESLGRSLVKRSKGSSGVQSSALWPHGVDHCSLSSSAQGRQRMHGGLCQTEIAALAQ